GNYLIEQMVHRIGIGHIGDDRQRVGTELASQCSGLLQRREATPGEGYGISMSQECERDSPADARTGPGNDSDFQVHDLCFLGCPILVSNETSRHSARRRGSWTPKPAKHSLAWTALISQI